jgi:hypothetical protein
MKEISMKKYMNIAVVIMLNCFLYNVSQKVFAQVAPPETDINYVLNIQRAKQLSEPIGGDPVIKMQIEILRNVFAHYKVKPAIRTERLQDEFMNLFQDIYNQATQTKDFNLVGFYKDFFKPLVNEVKQNKNLFKKEYIELFSQLPDRFSLEKFDQKMNKYHGSSWHDKLKQATTVLAYRKTLERRLSKIDVANPKKIVKNAKKLLKLAKKSNRRAERIKNRHKAKLFQAKHKNMFAQAVDTIAKLPFKNNYQREALLRLLKYVKKKYIKKIKNSLMSKTQRKYVKTKLIPYVRQRKIK